MKLDTTFASLQKQLSLCLKCLECVYGEWPESSPLCPIYNRHQIYTSSAGGLISFLKAVSDGRIDYTPTIAEFAYECTTCGICNVCELIPVLPPHVSPTDIIRFLRYQLVQRGLIPHGKVKAIYQQVRESGDYRGEKGFSIPEIASDDQVRAVLFAECIHSGGQRLIYEAAIRLIAKIDGPVTIFNEGGCCGSSLYDLGFWDELRALLPKKAEAWKKLQGKEVIFINPHCQEFMLKSYPQIEDRQLGITGRHFSEFLVAAFKEGKLKAKVKQGIKVSYHDPCYLGRGLGIYEAPRETLSFLEGVQLVEMKRNRKNAYCCGAGGSVRGGAFPEFSQGVAQERLAEFKATGADLLITACPYCKEAFQKVLPPNEQGKIKDLTEFVDERT